MKLDVLSRENGGTGHDPGGICSLGMTRIKFRWKICRLGKGSDIFDMGTMGKDN